MAAKEFESASTTNVFDMEESSLTFLQKIEITFGEEVKTAFESKCFTLRAFDLPLIWKTFSMLTDNN